jgi:hypothetical protein
VALTPPSASADGDFVLWQVAGPSCIRRETDIRLFKGPLVGSRAAAQECSPRREPWVAVGSGARPAERKVELYVVLRRCSEKRERRAFSQPLVITFSGTGSAENFSIARYFAAEVDPFAALLAHNSFAFVSGKLFRR